MTASSSASSRHSLRVSDLGSTGKNGFDIRFGNDDLAEALEILGIIGLSKVRFAGAVSAVGKADWELRGTVGATVTQPCVLTLDPVKTRIEEEVYRLFRKDMPEYDDGSVVELEQDESEEQLTAEIDLFNIAVEAIALGLPLYPKSEGASLENAVFAGDNVVPMTDEDAKPFASLAALKDKLSKE